MERRRIMEAIKRNSEILFIYDAKMSNPNGDMDNENKPRMDYDTDTNLVSDVRLKRYLRDYFEKQLGEDIFITENARDAKERGEQLKKMGKSHKDLIDCRMFGAVFAETGGSDHLTGPIQFNWGYSLNRVELNDSSTITSSFSSGEGIGKDYRVKYSVIAFNGSINANIAKGTMLSEKDIGIFDNAMVKAIPFCRTRSKMGQMPRFYLRVELIDDKTFLKDLREFISLNETKDEFKLRKISEFSLKIRDLVEYIDSYKEKIATLHFWKDSQLKLDGWDDMEKKFQKKIKPLNE
ncbi:MAG: type I-B CRISPR-associated protein Cas7/Csh2 [Planctomycetes bacterium]|nr:type I-B CRISPR-associated protein Cas7/Csh2 [Planctomycetota bacterium]